MQYSRKEWEDALHGLYRGEMEFGVPMKQYTNLGIGGPAELLLSPADPLSLKNLMLLLEKKRVPFLTLGSGTNVLVSDEGLEGVVILLRSFRMIQVIHEDDTYAGLFVEAGVPLQMLVNFCKERGYAGVEGLTGIPGTFGGAVCGNSGSYGYEIKDVVQSAVIMSPDGRLDRSEAKDLGFGYRRSAIQPDEIVLNANITLRKDDADAVAERVREFLKEKMNTQPISVRSAGCVFRNPDGRSAGKLIEEAGCKGMKIGGIVVSGLHANYFVNSGGGTASDYLALMHEVSLLVEKRCGVVLEPEIRVVGKG